MQRLFRIHGDNIVECERITRILIAETQPLSATVSLVSPSTLSVDLDFNYEGRHFSWTVEMLPGFNKAGRRRWAGNIFSALRESGSFLDETPDAIVTEVVGDEETILYAIEFCSALQAGNQAWQRSGRAFSTGRTGCPYLYIVDFVKYELDSRTRQRKALRFPNPAVPYSYINFSKETGNFVAQVYVKSEEFDKTRDRQLSGFDEANFADTELAEFMVRCMCGLDTSDVEEIILRKNLNVVKFLAQSSRTATNFSASEWEALYNSRQSIIDYSIENTEFNFHKTITAKGHHGRSPEVLELIDRFSVGLASRDLPFGIIPAENRAAFARGLQRLYPSFDTSVIRSIANQSQGLLLCLIKGFKPRGDDNRPDRGILPLAVMLSDTDVEVLTYIYGPIVEANFNLLLDNPKRLAMSNGLWRSILALSNYVALDVPILSRHPRDEEIIFDTGALKDEYTTFGYNPSGLTRPVFSSVPRAYHEDDVDTGIHYLFAHIMSDVCFEGMCNPPGGDWSGLSVVYGDHEVRWLSLPRVSDEVDGKRPDHVIEVFGMYKKPVLLAIESKERAGDLEPDVGTGLINYISSLMNFIPSVERRVNPHFSDWTQSRELVDFTDYITISAAAYLRSAAQPTSVVFRNSNCEMLFIMEPIRHGWDIEIISRTPDASVLKSFIIRKVEESSCDDIIVR